MRAVSVAPRLSRCRNNALDTCPWPSEPFKVPFWNRRIAALQNLH
jgi:hypothetical protein